MMLIMLVVMMMISAKHGLIMRVLKLTKTFTFLEEGTTKITATPIKWKEGKVILDIYICTT